MTEDSKAFYDSRNLIREAFRIDGITESECRSIFFDWAFGLKAAKGPRVAAAALLAAYDAEPRDHPMRILLATAAKTAPMRHPVRRGGRLGRRKQIERGGDGDARTGRRGPNR